MPEPMQLPEWIATLVGRLTLENEALRQALAAAQPPYETPVMTPEG